MKRLKIVKKEGTKESVKLATILQILTDKKGVILKSMGLIVIVGLVIFGVYNYCK